jgi:hypothetical protein
MTHSSTSIDTSVRPTLSTAPDTRLQGRPLLIARVTWVTLVLLTLALFGSMLPAYFTQLQTVCTAASQCADNQLTPDTVQMLRAHGLSVVQYAVFGFVFTLLVTLVGIVIAVLILASRSDDWMALLVALVLVMEGTICITYILQQSHSVWHWPAFVLNSLTFGAIFLCCSLFPDGRFVPRWTRWLTIIWIGWEVVFVILSVRHLSLGGMQGFPGGVQDPSLANNLVWAALCACCMIAQIYRYKRASGAVQRQQTRWVVYGVFLLITTVVTLEVPVFLFPALGPGSLYSLLSWYGIVLAFIPFPLTIGFAILRSRLWDIDIIIKRTLVYGLLTVALALIYFGCIVLLQSLFHALTGQGSSVALVGSTLAIAAIFRPLHKSIQTMIDRRFYRSKYLAEQTLQAFSSTLRDEMDLNHLQEELIKVVYETIQPAHVSLWLRNPVTSYSQKTQLLPQITEKERQ